MNRIKRITELAKVGLLLGVLAFVQLYLATRSLTSLLAIPLGVAIFVIVAGGVALLSSTPDVAETWQHRWTVRSVLELGLVAVLVVGSMVLRNADISPVVYVPMFVGGTIITVWSVVKTRASK